VKEGVLADNPGGKGDGWGRFSAKTRCRMRKRPPASHRGQPPAIGGRPPATGDSLRFVRGQSPAIRGRPPPRGDGLRPSRDSLPPSGGSLRLVRDSLPPLGDNLPPSGTVFGHRGTASRHRGQPPAIGGTAPATERQSSLSNLKTAIGEACPIPQRTAFVWGAYGTLRIFRGSSLAMNGGVLKISHLKRCVCGGTNPPHPQFYALKGGELTLLAIKRKFWCQNPCNLRNLWTFFLFLSA
jgi:hypothetical protein